MENLYSEERFHLKEKTLVRGGVRVQEENLAWRRTLYLGEKSLFGGEVLIYGSSLRKGEIPI